MLGVLLIDDDVNMLELLKTTVPWEQYGYAVTGTAKNGAEALLFMEHSLPNLIVTDVKMPVMDGLSFCKYVRQLRDDIPIILLSAYEDIETAKLAMKYNVTEYLLKPLNQQNIQLLCQILQELAHNYEQQLFFTSLCNLPDQQNEITARLISGDAVWFQDFFARFTNCFSISFQYVLAACLNMIQLLYANHPDGSRLIAEESYRLHQCATKLDMVMHVAGLYAHVLHANVQDEAPTNYQGQIFQQILEYLNNNFMQPDCSVSMLAERFHFSADHINRLFKRNTGETVNVYINKKRMEYALNLLPNLDLSINEVAIMAGFSNQTYFARLFRKNLQMSPTEYRLLQFRTKKKEG